MSERNWSFIFAAGLSAGGALVLLYLVWIVGLNYCPGEPCNYTRSPDPNPAQYEYNVPLAFGPYTSPSVEPEDTKGNPDYYNQKDLRAQESVARATNAIVVISLFSCALGIFGTGLLVWNLIEARKATKENATASAAAVEANRIAQEHSISSQRPWIDFEITDFRKFGFWIADGREMMIFTPVLKVTNFGNTPALNTHVRVSAFYGGAFSHQEGIDDVVGQYKTQFSVVIFPGKTREMDRPVGDMMKKSTIRPAGNPDSKGSIYLTIAVFYDDDLGHEHATGRMYHGRLAGLRTEPERAMTNLSTSESFTWFT